MDSPVSSPLKLYVRAEYHPGHYTSWFAVVRDPRACYLATSHSSPTKWFANVQGASLYALLSMTVGTMIRLTHPDFCFEGPQQDSPQAISLSYSLHLVWRLQLEFINISGLYGEWNNKSLPPKYKCISPSPSYRKRNSSYPSKVFIEVR